MDYLKRGSHPSWKGVRGRPEAQARLQRIGQWATDVDGDGYYCLPGGPIVHLYADGTWDVDNFAKHEALDDYLDDVEAKLAIIAKAR